jgi:hypothetical protein
VSLASSASVLHDEDPKGRHELERRRGVRDAGARPALVAADGTAAEDAGETEEAAGRGRSGERGGWTGRSAAGAGVGGSAGC